MFDSVESARKQYNDFGFDTLPVIRGGKRPYGRAWQKRLPYRLWQNTPHDTNIGIRGGGLADVAFIDCDERKTFEHITSYLAGLGYRGDSYPIVQTPSGEGRHIYITLAGDLQGDARDLSQAIGKGEFRYGSGAMVVAPPSTLSNGSSYRLLSGDFSIRPTLEVKDILPILGNRETIANSKPAIPRRAVAMLRGESDKTYKSRSHFDQSLIASLVNAGFTFEDVLGLFENNKTSGKYHEIKETKNYHAALHYLKKSYEEARKWTLTHESKARQQIKAATEWAESRAWQGKTGAIDQLVYLAHTYIAYKAGRLNYAASCRDLADMAGIGRSTASRSTWRLRTSGLLIPDKSAIADCANTYRLSLDIMGHSPIPPSVRKCPALSDHDVFRYRGLGKSAGQIYAILQENPANIAELVQITGRHIKTIKRNLERMRKLTDKLTGEYLPMVASDDGETYYLLPVDLNRIAHVVGTTGQGREQRKRHAKERRFHRKLLELGRQSSLPLASGDSEKV